MAQQITIDIVAETQRLQRGLDDANKKLSGLQSATSNVQNLSTAFVGVGVAAAGFNIAGNFISGATEATSDLGESINAVNVAFGEAASGIDELGKVSASSLGISRTEFNAAAVRFSSFADTIAGDGGDVVATVDELTNRAADFASVYNIDVDDALAKFQSGLAGSSEPLRGFGVDLSAVSVAAYAVEAGIVAEGEALTEAQKIQARYGLLLKETSKTQGDFANTSDGLANSTRILEAQQADLNSEMGEIFIPIMQEINKIVKVAVDIFSSMPKPIQQGVIVFGLLVAILGPAILLVSSMITAVKTVSAVMGTWSIITKTATVLQGIFNAVMAANPIGLVVLAIIALIAIIVLLVKNWDKVTEVVGVVWERIQEFAKQAVEAIGKMVSGIGDWLKKVSEAFSEVWGNISKYVGEVVTNLVNKFLEIPKQMVEVGKNIVEGLWNGISGLASWFRDKVLGFFGGLLPGWIKNVLGINSPSKVFEGIGENIVQGTAKGLSVPTLSSSRAALNGGVNITINAGLGTNPYQLGKEVNNALTSYSRIARV